MQRMPLTERFVYYQTILAVNVTNDLKNCYVVLYTRGGCLDTFVYMKVFSILNAEKANLLPCIETSDNELSSVNFLHIGHSKIIISQQLSWSAQSIIVSRSYKK